MTIFGSESQVFFNCSSDEKSDFKNEQDEECL